VTTESVIGLIDEACDAYADRDCLIHGDLHLSFREVQEASCRIANGLIAAGLSKGMRGARPIGRTLIDKSRQLRNQRPETEK